MLTIEKVTKIYDKFKVVDIDKLNVPSGTILGFLGKNGAGKTTTIKLVTGMLRPNTGYIKINGFDVHTQPMHAKKLIGYSADKANVYEKLTCREFLRFMANLYGVKNSSKLEDEICELLEKFDLTEKADNYIQSYSHGMKKKASLLGALIHKPKVLILDEPTDGLDPQSIKVLKDIILERKQAGATIFLSTHILEVAEKLCDLITIINKGKILFTGTLSELKESMGKDSSLEEAFLEITADLQEGK
ncbi:ABC transporter ATP-binding protein [Paenibacillus marchantiophytorum]|uniref:ABC transporter ATP-binding protein n=1 Tax=Paenibacillus marchantiophytorum TaxID=1619310 RepID=A0ABQ1ESB2_9BACL|nr:ABC transporter ATP-binding protein [Paenibacillus marchantiophytorum]GFZ85098.1 ABC transporter ATP-binding protein [Paenibacillus marchantiophytorum]